MPTCPECGEETSEGENYCSNCGAELDSGSDENADAQVDNGVGISNRLILVGILLAVASLTLFFMNNAPDRVERSDVTVENVEWVDAYANTQAGENSSYYGEITFTLKASESAPENLLVKIPTLDDYENPGGLFDRRIDMTPGESKRITLKTRPGGLVLYLDGPGADKSSAVGEYTEEIDVSLPDPEENEIREGNPGVVVY